MRCVVYEIVDCEVLSVREAYRGDVKINLGHACWYTRRAVARRVKHDEDATRKRLQQRRLPS